MALDVTTELSHFKSRVENVAATEDLLGLLEGKASEQPGDKAVPPQTPGSHLPKYQALQPFAYAGSSVRKACHPFISSLSPLP